MVSTDRSICEDEDERRRQVLPRILSGLRSQIPVEGLSPAGECIAMMLRPSTSMRAPSSSPATTYAPVALR